MVFFKLNIISNTIYIPWLARETYSQIYYVYILFIVQNVWAISIATWIVYQDVQLFDKTFLLIVYTFKCILGWSSSIRPNSRILMENPQNDLSLTPILFNFYILANVFFCWYILPFLEENIYHTFCWWFHQFLFFPTKLFGDYIVRGQGDQIGQYLSIELLFRPILIFWIDKQAHRNSNILGSFMPKQIYYILT